MADRDRVEKLVGMLTSDFEGERANAAAFLARMAKDEKKSLPELLKATLGSNPYSGSTVRSSWGAADAAELGVWRRRFYEIAQEKQDAIQRAERAERQLQNLRRDHEQLNKNADALRAQLHAYRCGMPKGSTAEPPGADSPPWEGEDRFRRSKGSRTLLDELYDRAADAIDDDPFYLSQWEVDFVNSMANVNADRDLSDRQRETVDKILKKLRKLEAEPLI